MTTLTTYADHLTIAVLGTGRMAELHLASLAKLRERGLEVDGQTIRIEPTLCGRRVEKVTALAERFGLPRTSTRLEDFITSPDVDVVDNCLINAEHYEPLMEAIRHGKHVFVEKPLTTDLERAERLLAAAHAAGVHHGIVQNMRFCPGPRKAKELMTAGVVGRVFTTDLRFGYMVPATILNRPAWFHRKQESGGGIILDMMSHFFDLLRYLIGPIRSVYAATAIAWNERREPNGTPFQIETEDIGMITVRFTSGALGSCFASWVRRTHEDLPRVQVDGEDASLLFNLDRLWMQTRTETPLVRMGDRTTHGARLSDWTPVEMGMDPPLGLQLEEFLRGIIRHQPTTPDWQDALATHHLIEAAYRSAAARREVDVADVTSPSSV